jgi:hypothetical protein
MKNTFKCYCEGDIERFAKALKEMIEAAKPQEVVVKCPGPEWPFMIMDMIYEDFEGMPEQEENFIDITFAPDTLGSAEWEAEARELQEKIDNMSDEDLQDFLDDLLSDLEDKDDDDTEDSEGAD